MRTRAGWLGLVLFAVLVISRTSSAYYLDDERRFDFRLRSYAQLGMLTENSETPSSAQKAFALSFLGPTATPLQRRAQVRSITPPDYDAWNLSQQRNFYNPEFDANLSDFMHWAYADEFKFRAAWWGFYDGIYDYLD